MNNKKYHRKIKNKLNKDWTNQDNQTKVELAYMLHYMGFSPQSHVPQQVLKMLQEYLWTLCRHPAHVSITLPHITIWAVNPSTEGTPYKTYSKNISTAGSEHISGPWDPVSPPSKVKRGGRVQ